MNALATFEDVSFEYRIRSGFFNSHSVQVLKDLNFAIYKGETFGVVGGNGAGKSTLLKLLAGIHVPASGRLLTPKGLRVSLLSLQLGFSPKLSGRDNAIMGAIFLGKTKSEAEKRLPEIIAYSELEGWIDEPLKTYSTGMRARLGFAVAMEMAPDILLVDEVLGVGDQSFRIKSTSSMKQKMKAGQTAVFVSHNLQQVADICSRVCWMDRGRVRMLGIPSDVVEAYSAARR